MRDYTVTIMMDTNTIAIRRTQPSGEDNHGKGTYGRETDLVGLLAFEHLEYLFRSLLRRLHLRCLMVVVMSEL